MRGKMMAEPAQRMLLSSGSAEQQAWALQTFVGSGFWPEQNASETTNPSSLSHQTWRDWVPPPQLALQGPRGLSSSCRSGPVPRSRRT